MKIVVPCPECNGNGLVADRHPNDPSCQDIECSSCGGSAEEYVNDEMIGTEEEAKADYPEMIRCED